MNGALRSGHRGQSPQRAGPARPRRLPAFLEQLREPSGELEAALAEASRVCAWQPRVEVTVYASSADADVPISNADHCVESFRASGSEAKLLDLGDADHSQSMTRSLPLVLAQFEQRSGL